MRMSLAGLKKFLQDHQVPASGYYNAMSYMTHVEASKAKRVYEAFQQALDTPRRRGAPAPGHEAAPGPGGRLTPRPSEAASRPGSPPPRPGHS